MNKLKIEELSWKIQRAKAMVCELNDISIKYDDAMIKAVSVTLETMVNMFENVEQRLKGLEKNHEIQI